MCHYVAVAGETGILRVIHIQHQKGYHSDNSRNVSSVFIIQLVTSHQSTKLEVPPGSIPIFSDCPQRSHVGNQSHRRASVDPDDTSHGEQGHVVQNVECCGAFCIL